MKIHAYLSTAVALLFGTAAAMAQGSQPQVIVAGKLMGMSNFDITDMLRNSQYNYTFGTARTAAMGGAFTSLGADLSSMNINPAGLGMYQSSQFGITQAITVTTTGTAHSGNGSLYTLDNTNTKYNLNNVGLALNVFQGSGTLTSFTIGFGYNKLANFNALSGFGVNAERYGIGDVMINQLYDMQRAGITQTDMNSSSEPFRNSNIFVNEWGSVLAYQTEFVFGEEDGNFTLDRSISANATVNSFLKTRIRGGIDEYTISGGVNLKNILYLGATIGLQSIRYEETCWYDESYNNNEAAYPLNYLLYDQRTRYYGTGVNFKFGAVLQPIPRLRIGLAVHTPTFISLTQSYQAAMDAVYSDMETYKETPTNKFDYNFNSPTRLLTGISYTFGSFAILSVDYERAWYNGMRLTDVMESVKEAFKYDAKTYLTGSNILRAGLEVRPVPQWAIRAGGGYYGSMVRTRINDLSNAFSNPVPYESYNITAGLGYTFGACTFDLAYVYTHSKSNPFDLFYYQMITDAGPEEPIAQSGYFEQKTNRHMVALTFGVKF